MIHRNYKTVACYVECPAVDKRTRTHIWMTKETLNKVAHKKIDEWNKDTWNFRLTNCMQWNASCGLKHTNCRRVQRLGLVREKIGNIGRPSFLRKIHGIYCWLIQIRIFAFCPPAPLTINYLNILNFCNQIIYKSKIGRKKISNDHEFKLWFCLEVGVSS